MEPPDKGEVITSAYLTEQYKLAQAISQQIQQAEIALRELQRTFAATRAFPGKITGGTGPYTFDAYTVAGGVYQKDPSRQAEGCSAISKPFAAIGVNNIPIASGTGVPFAAIIQTAATGSFPTWHYQVKRVVGYDSSRSQYKNARFITDNQTTLSAQSGMDMVSSTYPYTSPLGVTITSAGGQVNSTACHVKPFGPLGFVSVVPLRDKAINATIYRIVSSENSAQ